MAELINRDGTEVRINLRDEAVHWAIFAQPARQARCATPASVDLSRYDLVGRDAGAAIHQPHGARSYGQDRCGEAAVPVDHDTMPPLPYLKRIPALAEHGSRGGLQLTRRCGSGLSRVW